MRFFGRLLRAVFARGEQPSRFLSGTLEEELRKNISKWQHQAVLYEQAGLPRAARRCRKVADKYRARLVALMIRNEAV